MKKLGILMAMFFVLAMVMPAWAQPDVSLNPEYAQRNLDGKVRMHIILSQATDLLSMGIKISFDPTKLQVDTDPAKTSKNNDVWEFTDLLPSPLAYAPDIEIDNGAGTVTMIGGRLQPGITGTDVLLGWVTFDCIAGDGTHTTQVPVNVQLAHPYNPPPPPPDSYDNFVREDGYVDDPNMNIGNTATQLGTICIVDTNISSIEACEGDFNADGHVLANDKMVFRSALFSHFGDTNYDPACDFNADGHVLANDKMVFRPDLFRHDCPCN